MKKEERHTHSDYQVIKKEKRKVKAEKIILVFLYILGIIVIAGIIFYGFKLFYYQSCSDKSCFDSRLNDCKRTKYFSEGKTIYEYSINGKEGESCVVGVKLIGGDFSDVDLEKLREKSMDCYVPLGIVVIPESDINNCHGELKEALQDIIINRLNVYIIDNVGKINYDIYKSLTQNVNKTNST